MSIHPHKQRLPSSPVRLTGSRPWVAGASKAYRGAIVARYPSQMPPVRAGHGCVRNFRIQLGDELRQVRHEGLATQGAGVPVSFHQAAEALGVHAMATLEHGDGIPRVKHVLGTKQW
mgnify:CR=1 FL=1